MSLDIKRLELLDLTQKLNKRQAGKRDGPGARGGSNERVNNAQKLHPFYI